MGPPALGALSAVFSAHLAGDVRCTDASDLEAQLEARLAAGRATWPDVELDAPSYVRHLAERTTQDRLPGLDRSADLFLACACAHGDPRAIAAFDRALRPELARALARSGASPAFTDDVLQVMSERLFVRSGDAGLKITEYAGRASLRSWLITVAKRTAMNLRRGKVNEANDALRSGTTAALGHAVAPDVALIKARFKAELETAIRAALDQLPERSRTLLLLHLVDGVTLPRLAQMHAVSRATVARWLVAARDALRDATRTELLGRLRLTPSEVDSVAALVRSQLEVSLVAAVRAHRVST